jgi:hypothetical protein
MIGMTDDIGRRFRRYYAVKSRQIEVVIPQISFLDMREVALVVVDLDQLRGEPGAIKRVVETNE